MRNIIINSEHGEGTSSDFIFYLPSPIYLDRNVEYEAGLAEIHLPVAWFNLDEPYCFSLSHGRDRETLVLEPRHFSAVEELVDSLNELLVNSGMLFFDARSDRDSMGMEAADESGLVESNQNNLGIRFEIYDLKVCVQNNTSQTELFLPENKVLHWLGFGGEAATVGPGRHEGRFCVGCPPCSLIHVHSSIIESGSCNASSLLRTINVNSSSKWGTYQTEVFKKVIFHPLERVNFLVSFKVQLRDIFGKVLKPQICAPVLLTLQLRERKAE